MADGGVERASGAEVQGWHVVLRDGRVAYVGTRARCTVVAAEWGERWPRSRWVVSYRVVAT